MYMDAQVTTTKLMIQSQNTYYIAVFISAVKHRTDDGEGQGWNGKAFL